MIGPGSELSKLLIQRFKDAEELSKCLHSPKEFCVRIGSLVDLYHNIKLFPANENDLIRFIFKHTEVCKHLFKNNENLLEFAQLFVNHMPALANYMFENPRHFGKIFNFETLTILLINFPESASLFVKAFLSVPEFLDFFRLNDHKFLFNLLRLPSYAKLFFDLVIEDTSSIKYKDFIQNFETLLSTGNAEPADLLESYLDYVLFNEGISITPKPVTLNQNGPHCAYYAARCAADYYYMLMPHRFKNLPLFPRKCDSETAVELSMRQVSKSFVKTKFGIFNTDDMLRVIALTECRGEKVEIKNEEHFVDVIKTSILKKIPIILPYAVDNKHNPTLDPFDSHWAVVYGYKEKHSKTDSKIYVSSDGSYWSYKTSALFHSFHNLKDSPSCEIVKEKGGEWTIKTAQTKLTSSMSVATLPPIDFQFFRRQLILVHPPLDRKALVP